MRIKLIYTPKYAKELSPKQALGNAALPPLGIASITSAMKLNGYHCEQDDLNIKVAYDNVYERKSKSVNLSVFEGHNKVKKFLETKNDPELEEEAEKILKKTDYKKFDIIGLSILEEVNPSSMSIALALSKVIKENSNAEIALGGINYPRPVTEVQDFLNSGLIDYVLMGDGEWVLLHLLYAIEKNYVGKYKIQNIFTNQDDRNKPLLKKVDGKYYEFPRPDFDGFPLQKYILKPERGVPMSRKKVLVLPYVFVKGCSYNCIFCPASKTPEYQINQADKVVEDLKCLSEKYKTKYFLFINNTINPSYEYAENFIKEMKKEDLNIMWADCANFKGMDLKTLKGLKDVGAIKLLYGIESASPKMQKYTLKNIDINQASTLLKESHNLGIWNELELIAGMPYETDQDINSTINFIKTNQNHLEYCYLNSFRLVDSLLLKKPEAFGITNIKDNMKRSNEVTWFSRRFDETNGLKWEQKEKQILRSYNLIKKAIELEVNQKRQYFPGWDIRLLFYLYSVYNNKQDVSNYFKEREKRNQSYFERLKYGISKIRKNKP
jgi:radical SAM superfamily enzyme YgiQ (UPF0313 family)